MDVTERKTVFFRHGHCAFHSGQSHRTVGTVRRCPFKAYQECFTHTREDMTLAQRDPANRKVVVVRQLDNAARDD